MSAIGDALGGIGGVIGSPIGGLTSGIMGASGIKSAPIVNPVTGELIQGANQNVADSLRQQAEFLAALQGQGGIQNQSNIYNALNQIAQGQGANPAQAMLANATGANVANQAALMAGQRGAAQNPALIARQAAQQGGAMQQQAAGQAAAMQAQQQLAALQAQGNIAGQMVQNQANAANAYANAALQNQGNVFGAQGAFNTAAVGNQAGLNQAATGIAGGLFSGAGAALSPKGGKAHGGMITEADRPNMARGGEVPVMLSPGEIYLPPEEAKQVANGKPASKAGTRIPGKAKVKGDSLKNDTVPTKLQEGGVVVPRTKANSDEAAARFVQAVLAKSSIKRK